MAYLPAATASAAAAVASEAPEAWLRVIEGIAARDTDVKALVSGGCFLLPAFQHLGLDQQEAKHQGRRRQPERTQERWQTASNMRVNSA